MPIPAFPVSAEQGHQEGDTEIRYNPADYGSRKHGISGIFQDHRQAHIHGCGPGRGYRGERPELPRHERGAYEGEHFPEYVRQKCDGPELRRELRPEGNLLVLGYEDGGQGVIAHPATYRKAVGQSPTFYEDADGGRTRERPEYAR